MVGHNWQSEMTRSTEWQAHLRLITAKGQTKDTGNQGCQLALVPYGQKFKQQLWTIKTSHLPLLQHYDTIQL